MNGSELNELRRRLGLSQEATARVIGVSVRTVARWEAGQSVPSPMAARQLRALADLARRLERLFRPDSIPDWMERPLNRLGGRTPHDVLLGEGAGALLRVVLEMISGAAPGEG